MNNINVLHLCSYYYGSKLYENLFTDFSNKGVNQTVYIPVKNGTDVGNINMIKNCEFIVKETSTNLDRFFFYRKANKNYNNLVFNRDLKKFNIVHAHTLFTNGFMAYRLKKEYGIPYIVAVRNTDVNVFFKYFIHLRRLGVDIMKEAEKIVFISHSYLENTIDKYVPNKYKEEIKNKSIVIPNGLNNYWVENKIKTPNKLDKKTINLVYVGEVTKNKNIHKVIEDIEIMNKKGLDVRYKVVGDGDYLNELEKLLGKMEYKDKVTLMGRINNKDEIKDILDKSDIFVMNSTFETFGLSYIEALSRGLPVIYTKGQGIYGYFDEGYIGYGVKTNESIEKYVENIISNYETMSHNTMSIINDFRWEVIGEKYIDLYNRLLEDGREN
ncbi:glycosyltransferase family 4 protein [Clostridium sp.]|uniref:glycosyltransferase family 4 protein n=1 Tax=Clostridium sp. TaxID=1506 RepID=UPI001DF6BB32|nr:glycosyltransferase family 4 protein [Clostridium sp.]MBS5938017.1 glycosyltransferase family 4 protein [Clostridium sp.]